MAQTLLSVPSGAAARVYGLKGQSTGTVGVGVPDTLHGTITNYYGIFSGIDDTNNSPCGPYIRKAITLLDG